MIDNGEQRAWLRLALTQGVGPRARLDLLSVFGLPAAIFEAGRSALVRVVGEEAADALQSPAPLSAIEHALAWLHADRSRSLLTLADQDYPEPLLQLADPAAVLYLQGRRELLGAPALAIVGSRNATRQGELNARAFAAHLGSCGLAIVSGLARGIDAAAHLGALEADAATIAVLGTGADIAYPASNRALAERIGRDGLLLSEYPLGTPGVASNFPRRNRLIAAIARGVLVVEAAMQSGSLITARLAAELGREVMAIPGSIHSPLARGCHRLIREGARLVESAQDVLQELGMESLQATAAAAAGASATAIRDEALLEAIGFDPVDLDTLSQRTGLDSGALSARLLELELTQDVERLAGNRYQRLGRG